ncbi:hypothetical protein CCACVL1_28362 [Corchorus capsularis]|uniref:KIB1-4 beta-propeller domain-containing protein n=1 Tax=Corchorus capsularis TaxID=210143 RepID=A0A1R3G6Q4_COCAP|nr:hypothetical protein CCACVL1_28362 [Corchorus capsularis]
MMSDSFDFKELESASSEVFRNWANLPCDLLSYIASKTHPSMQDFVRMSAVCRPWQASLKDPKPKFPICLMLGEKEDDNDNRRCFVTASEDKVMEFELSEIRKRRCWGSPFGWIATYGLDDEIGLFNPLTKAYLSLPPLGDRALEVEDMDRSKESLGLKFIFKLLLSSCPTSPDCIVMAIYGSACDLTFTRMGDEAWTPIESNRSISDVTYFNGNFFAVTILGELLICQGLEGPSPKAVEFADPPPQFEKFEVADFLKYMVELDGHLCMIGRKHGRYRYDNEEDGIVIENCCSTEGFGMVRLDIDTRNWDEISSLGDRSLFLGNCCTFTILASDYYGCISNCIYFTYDFLYEGYHDLEGTNCGGGLDTGIYHCDDKETLIRLPDVGDDDQPFRSIFSPPIWILPSSH